MKKDERGRAILDEARNALAAGAAGAAAAAVGGGSAGIVAAGAVFGASSASLAMFVNVARSWKERDATRWWFDVLHNADHDGKTPEEIARVVAENQDKPFVRETILRATRALLDAPDECTVTALALLAREYIRDKKSPDYFFRGACGMFMSCSRSEFDQLRDIAAAVVESFGAAPEVDFVRLEEGSLREGLLNVVDSKQVQRPVAAADGARLIRRLCAEELAIEIGMMDQGVRSGVAHCRLVKDPGLRFLKLVLA